jgi:hypothetical protein
VQHNRGSLIQLREKKEGDRIQFQGDEIASAEDDEKE